MTDRVAIITGVAGGIGRATAELLGKRDWYVVGLDQYNADSNMQFMDEYHQVDLSHAEAVSSICGTMKTSLPRLDALINNAAVQVCKSILETTPAEWDEVMAVNVRSAFLMARDLYLSLKATSGSIVNISSVHALATSSQIAAYAASKGALNALTRAMAIEFAPEVRVNAVLPGATDTAMLEAGLARGHLEKRADVNAAKRELAARTLSGRIAKPEDIAEQICFLADGQLTAYVTGQCFVVDGGVLCKLSSE